MIDLSESEREKLRTIMKGAGSAREINRAYALNMRDKGFTVIEIADSLEITPRTVINICNKYREEGIQRALHDNPHPGRPREFDERTRIQVVATVCSNPPEGFDRWTLDLIKERLESEGTTPSIGRETIRAVLQEHDLKPWQQKMWCIPELTDEFIERMEDVLDVYERPYDPKKPVVCIDEKPVVLTADKREPIPMREGQPKRVDSEYVRNGSVNTFCGVEPKTGVYLNRVTPRRTADEFAKFIDSVERKFSDAEKIVLVMDNLSTHKEKSLTQYYGKEEGEKLWSRFEVHYTPKHGSWLNQAEIAIGMYHRQCLGNSRIPHIQALRKKTTAWNRIVNRKKLTIQWGFSKNDARKKFHYT